MYVLGSAGLLPAATRPLFEEGLALVLRRWTALSLAVEHGWGGPQSAAKAEELYANLLEWFYTGKGGSVPYPVCHVLSCVPSCLGDSAQQKVRHCLFFAAAACWSVSAYECCGDAACRCSIVPFAFCDIPALGCACSGFSS